ncbi:MAG TPA: BamA/TamA family outer membrane protein [Bryobacteraceae bacterium]|nr:BamA/TamA family outer membrane protein [Bryobacteraceae bacterium]
MKYTLIGLLFSGLSLWGGNQQPLPEPAEFNVNSRYTVESIELSHEIEARISRSLRQDVQKLIGEKLNPTALNDLARRIRTELNVRNVSQKVLKGNVPDHVKVVLDVAGRKNEWDLSVPKVIYQSTLGFSGAVEGTAILGDNRFTAGVVSDGDELAERYTGVRARYENRKLGSDRVRLRFDFGSYHEQWNQSTLSAIAKDGAVPGIYRSRQNFAPVATLVLAKPLTLSLGADFQRFDMQLPVARTQSANAAITALRYDRRFEGPGGDQQEFEAGYNLRAATRALNSDFAYARHQWELRYSFTRGRHMISDEALAGLITGQAPLFERFTLGTSSMLRGWNKYELDPLGGSRVALNSLEYRYGMVEVFYDTGAVWDPGQDVVARHSIGVGLRKSSFLVAMAFPIKEGRASPVFMVGMNY